MGEQAIPLTSEVRWVEMKGRIAVERLAQYETDRQAKRRARDLRRRGCPAVVMVAQRMWHGGIEAWRAA